MVSVSGPLCLVLLISRSALASWWDGTYACQALFIGTYVQSFFW